MKRVLIIESEIVPRLLYQAKFQTAGFEVYAALTPDLTILVEAAKHLAGRSAKTPTPNLLASARNGKLGVY